MLKTALFDYAINEKCCSVYRGRGICPLFSSPSRGIWQLKSPHPREFAIQGKKMLMRGGQPRGALGAAGIDWCIMIQWKPDCWSRKQKQKDKPITMHIPMLCEWFSSPASAYDPHNLVFTWDLWTPKYFWNIILLQGKKPMKRKNTKSKQLVWVLLLACPDLCFDWSY